MHVTAWLDRARIAALCTVALGTLLAALPVALAEDYVTGFEELWGWFSGEPLTGQDGYYIPVAGSLDYYVYTYDGNTLLIPQNPTGELQFIGGSGTGSGVYARAQRDLMFDGGNVYYLAYDFCGAFLGTPPSAQNVGSFSMRDDGAVPALTHYIHLITWVDPNVPTHINAFFMPYDAGGTQAPQPGYSPGAAWENLPINHWYRSWIRVCFDTNMFLEVGIIDLETSIETTYVPTDWYLVGGAAGTTRPMSFRFFAGGGAAGNVLAFDNIDIHEEVPTPAEDTTWGAIKALYR
jgi:hypothetical protein